MSLMTGLVPQITYGMIVVVRNLGPYPARRR